MKNAYLSLFSSGVGVLCFLFCNSLALAQSAPYVTFSPQSSTACSNISVVSTAGSIDGGTYDTEIYDVSGAFQGTANTVGAGGAQTVCPTSNLSGSSATSYATYDLVFNSSGLCHAGVSYSTCIAFPSSVSNFNQVGYYYILQSAPPVVTSTSTALLCGSSTSTLCVEDPNVSFGLAVIIGFLSIAFCGYIFNAFTKRKKKWH